MSSPLLLVVDEDDAARRDVEAALHERYERHYELHGCASAGEARDTLRALAADGKDLALLLSALPLDGAAGTELLDDARRLHPTARRAQLIEWAQQGDPATGDALFEVIASGRIDHYV